MKRHTETLRIAASSWLQANDPNGEYDNVTCAEAVQIALDQMTNGEADTWQGSPATRCKLCNRRQRVAPTIAKWNGAPICAECFEMPQADKIRIDREFVSVEPVDFPKLTNPAVAQLFTSLLDRFLAVNRGRVEADAWNACAEESAEVAILAGRVLDDVERRAR